MTPLFWITMAALVITLIYDIRVGRIPNWLTYPAMILGLAYHSYVSGLQGFLLSSGGLLVGFGVFISFYLLGGMGAGDVKLMAAIGTLLGPGDVFCSAMLTAIAGGIYATVVILIYGFNRASLTRYGIIVKTFFLTGRFAYIPGETKMPPLRYGIAIAAGTLTVLLKRFV